MTNKPLNKKRSNWDKEREREREREMQLIFPELKGPKMYVEHARVP